MKYVVFNILFFVLLLALMEGAETFGGLRNWRDFWASHNLAIRLGIVAMIFGGYGILSAKRNITPSKAWSVFSIIVIIILNYLVMSLIEIAKYPFQDVGLLLSIGAIYLMIPMIVVSVFSLLLTHAVINKNKAKNIR